MILLNKLYVLRDAAYNAWEDVSVLSIMVVSLVCVFVGFFMAPSFKDKITYCIQLPAIMIVAELVNSCFEMVVDRIGPEYHILSKKIKDTSALACFVIYFVVGISILRLLLQSGVQYKKYCRIKQNDKKKIDEQTTDEENTD